MIWRSQIVYFIFEVEVEVEVEVVFEVVFEVVKDTSLLFSL